jgi:ABC-type dipeptide/oligopeptide/nickel transport system permease component
MIDYLIRRLGLTLLTLVTVSFVAFCGFGVSIDPSSPLRLSPDQRPRHAVVAHYHLEDPILSRYWRWVKSFADEGFGSPVSTSVHDNRVVTEGVEPIWPGLSHAVWISAQFIAFGLLLVVLGSVALGVFSARRQGSVSDGFVRFLTYVSWSIPTFLIAFFMRKWILEGQTVSSFVYGPNQADTHGAKVFLIGPPTGGVVDWFQHMTLPALALALGLIGVYARYVRSSMIGSLQQNYAVVARSKGLSDGQVVRRHALRNSLIPFVSALSLEIGAVVGASLAADWVFGLGGLASYTIQALGRSDPFQMTAVVIVLAAIVLVFVTTADLIVGWLDPRARIAAARA